MRAEKEVSDAVKPGNRPAPLKPEGDWSHAFSYHPMDVEVQKAEGIFAKIPSFRKSLESSQV